MPSETTYSNIISKENNPDRSDIADLIKAGKELHISGKELQTSVNKFVTALEKFTNVATAVESSTVEPAATAPAAVKSSGDLISFDEPPRRPTRFKYDEPPSKPYTGPKTKWGIAVDDIVKVQNNLKINNRNIPDKFKFGKVTRFNKRFVFFDVRYKVGNEWFTDEVWREPHNLAIYRAA